MPLARTQSSSPCCCRPVTTSAPTSAHAAGSAGARVAGPLGPDELLLTALTGRLAEAGVPAGTPVVLAAAGSADPVAGGEVQQQAQLLAERLAVPVLAAFATAARPTVPQAVARLSQADRRTRRGSQLPAGTWSFPGPAGDQRRRLGDGAARRSPGAGGPGHRQVPDGVEEDRIATRTATGSES